jgi:ribosomal protein S18 acetylase RimI-like enzyme
MTVEKADRTSRGDVALVPFAAEHAGRVRAWAEASPYSAGWLGDSPETGLGRPDVDDDVRRFVLTVDGEPRGYGELWVDEEEGEVELAHLLVDPAHRGRGYGAALVTEMLPLALPLAGDVLLRVDQENTRAIGVYSRLGFVHLESEELAVFNEGQPREYAWMRLPRDPA